MSSAFDNIAFVSVPTTSPLDTAYQPVFPEQAQWVGVLIIVIALGLFLAAMVIGPIARANKD